MPVIFGKRLQLVAMATSTGGSGICRRPKKKYDLVIGGVGRFSVKPSDRPTPTTVMSSWAGPALVQWVVSLETLH